MARSHDFVTPMLNGHPFLEKPPLYYAVAGLLGSMLGPTNDVAYRLASILFSVLTLLALFIFVRRRKGLEEALMAVLVLASSWEFFTISRWILVDISLVFGVTLAMLAWMRLAEDSKSKLSAIVLGLATSVAFFAKGMVGPAIIATAILTDIIRRRNFKLVYKSRPDIILSFTLIPVVLWTAALWNSGGWSYVREVIVVNNLMRFTGAREAAVLGHQHGIFYYFTNFPGTLMPWTLAFIPAITHAAKRYRQESAISWVIGPFILLSLASTKRSLYLAPLVPACAMMIATWLRETPKAKWERIILHITWGVAVAGAVAPLAGLGLGIPTISLISGIIAIAALVVIDRDQSLRRTSIALTLSICIAMGATMTVVYKYRQPKEDYLAATRQALAISGNNQIRLISDDEIFEGVVPMLTGHNVDNILLNEGSQVRTPGYYLWSDDKHGRTSKQIRRTYQPRLLLERSIGHDRKIRLAYINPRQ